MAPQENGIVQSEHSSRLAAKNSLVIRYTAESNLLDPVGLLRGIWNDLTARQTWDLARQLATRDISASYRQSILGYAWSVMPTIALAAGLTAAAHNRIIQFGSTSIPYAAYVIIGLVLWQTFIEALTSPLNALSLSRSVLARINVKKEALIIGKTVEVIFNLSVKLLLVAAVMVLYGIAPSWSLLLAPVGLIAIIAFGTGLGLIIAPIGLLYDDIRRTIPLVAQFGLILTPVVYAMPQNGVFAALVKANPVTPLVMSTRDWMTGEPVMMIGAFVLVFASSFLLLSLGLIALRLVTPFAIERLSS